MALNSDIGLNSDTNLNSDIGVDTDVNVTTPAGQAAVLTPSTPLEAEPTAPDPSLPHSSRIPKTMISSCRNCVRPRPSGP